MSLFPSFRVLIVSAALGLALGVVSPPAPPLEAVPASSSTAALVQGAAFEVIVNATAPVEQVAKADVARFFLKKVRAWPNGQLVDPVDLGEDSPVRVAFSTKLLGKDVATVRGYWQQQLYTGRGVPPVTKANDAEVAAYVAAHPGAIGYVSAGATLPAGVKVVKVAE